MFLCVDFDEADYEDDVRIFIEMCESYHIPAYIERSRSGNGAHVWIFFEEPIAASIARRLATVLLTHAMNERSEIKFKSYDRLFPNQDTMPSGGFGNLIALPLQGQARKCGNSLFVDEEFLPYSDQWAFLDSIDRLSKTFVEELVSELCKNGEFGTLVSDSDEKPWESKKRPVLSAFDFPETVTIIRANMLYISKEHLSASAKNRIKRLAAFKNPEFYRSQAMRLPIYNKPRIICIGQETKDYIALPRGCEDALYELLNENNIHFTSDDKTNLGQLIGVSFNGNLRDEQVPAVESMLAHKTGILSATTAFGKTVIAANIIATHKVNTLILVHTRALLIQWQKSLEQFLTLDLSEPVIEKRKGRKKKWSPIGILSGGMNTLHGVVDIAVMQSLTDGDEVKEFVRDYGMIIVDECHHVSAVNFEMILRYANAAYVYGLTATPTRHDGHHPIIYMQCGQIRYRVDAKCQAAKRAFSHYVIPRFTSYRTFPGNKGICELYRDLSESDIRNRMIVNDVVSALQNSRNPIILTERKEHVAQLAEMLLKYYENTIILTGASSVKMKRETEERLNAIPADQPLIIIATGKYVGEGFDYPRLDTLFLALPIAWKGKVAQYAGRLHRNYPGKTDVQIYDYADIHIPVLERMYQKRVKSYASIGYQTKANTIAETTSLIYDGKSFYPVYCGDIETAEKEIMIVSPFMRKSRLAQITRLLAKALINGISISVVTRPPEDFKEKDREVVINNTVSLGSYGIKVIYKSNFHQKFTVIDQKIVWYGSVNFLNFGTTEESIMRFESYDIAGELMDTVL